MGEKQNGDITVMRCVNVGRIQHRFNGSQLVC